MFLSLSVVMIVVILIVVIPFSIFIIIDKKRKFKYKQIFQNNVRNHNLDPDVEEYWNQYYLAHDEGKNMLIYLKKEEEGMREVLIDLNEVRKCAIRRITNDYKSGDKNLSELSKLEMEFDFIAQQPNVTITFYDADDRIPQNQELVRAEKWLALVDQYKYRRSNAVVA